MTVIKSFLSFGHLQGFPKTKIGSTLSLQSHQKYGNIKKKHFGGFSIVVFFPYEEAKCVISKIFICRDLQFLMSNALFLPFVFSSLLKSLLLACNALFPVLLLNSYIGLRRHGQ
jgi:hypothetical protein